MTYVHTCAAGIREFDQSVELGLRAVIFRTEDLILFPFHLPLGLDAFEIVFHNHSSI